jgi:predicted nuclease of predicted toxin-antitoxin system
VKILLDTCVSGGVRTEIASAGHDVLWVGDRDQDPGDEEILAQAHVERRVLVTLDKDFGELAIVRERPHAGIVRLVGVRVGEQARVCLAVVDR